jgi:hypothetical protein
LPTAIKTINESAGLAGTGSAVCYAQSTCYRWLFLTCRKIANATTYGFLSNTSTHYKASFLYQHPSYFLYIIGA